MNPPTQLELSAAPGRRHLFDGDTFDGVLDGKRLNRQLDRVREFMAAGGWHTIPEIAKACGGSENGVAARLRDLRKLRFGGHTVKRARVLSKGLWHYKLVLQNQGGAIAPEVKP